MIPRLVMRNICKRFGATHALQDISLEAHSQETLALIGENGAGKSTLMKILSGAYTPDAGTMTLDGVRYAPRGPQEARRAGVAMVYQELSLAPDLSVEENIMLGQERSRFGFVRKSEHQRRVREVLGLLGRPDLDLNRTVQSLSIGTQQIVEIARGLASNAKVIVFDEPTSSLSQQDVHELFQLIERLEKQGIAVVYISHFLEEIRQVATRYQVLRDGQGAGQGTIDQVTNTQIVSLMVGRDVKDLFPTVEHRVGPSLLRVQELSGEKMPHGVSFDLHQGEILGLFGLIGAGRTETLRLLLGLDRGSFREYSIREKPVGQGVQNRMRHGLGMVSEDRKREGLFQAMSIVDNLTMSRLAPYSRCGILSLTQRRNAAREWMKKLSIKGRTPEQSISQLSGGNQQKVAIARVLHEDASILLLDEPTRGIDVGTKSEIYRWIGELAASGKSIVFVSSYLPELMAICDRIGVMASGVLRDIRKASDWTEREILATAVLSTASPSEPIPQTAVSPITSPSAPSDNAIPMSE